MVPAIRTYAQPIATILVGFLALCGVLGGIFFTRRTGLRATYRDRVAAAQARVRARHIEPELRALYDDLAREVAAMDVAPGPGVPAAAFDAAVAATGTRRRVNALSDAFAEENRLADQLAELVDAQAHVLSWLLVLGTWVLVGLLGLLILTFWNVPSEAIIATVYATALATMWMRLGQRLVLAVRGELELDRRLTEIEGRD